MVTWLAMALLKPFRALRYDVGRAGTLDDVVSPPHDIITPEQRERLLAASPYNAVRLVHPREPNEAARALAEWTDQGILVREEDPAVWVLEEHFVGPDGVPRRRRGLVARARLEPYSAGRVLPHERTFSPQKEARLPLLRATRVKLSPIFLLHGGDGPPGVEGEPDLAATLEGVTSRLWRITQPELVEEALAAVGGRLLIADGHHRYETALRFHEEEGSAETAHVLAGLVALADPGLCIFATHRLVGGAVPELDGLFRLTSVSGGVAEALAALDRVPRDRPAFVLLGPDKTVLAEADGSGFDTTLVDGLMLEDVRYTPSAADAERAVASGEAAAALLVRAPTVEQVEAVALAGERLPEKSTYFYPKLASGLLFSPFDE
jgi:uncharacterized protein (DUF1015 family)